VSKSPRAGAEEDGEAAGEVLHGKLRLSDWPGGVVARPRLLSRLDDALGCGVALVQGPAGTGKSTLVMQWLAATHRRAAVVRLDRWDDDPVRFWTHVTAATQAGLGEVGGAAQSVLQAGGRGTQRAVVTALLNELDALTVPAVLVLEDAHLVESPEVWDSLGVLLRYRPAALAVLLTARSDPPWPAAALRTEGRLRELREPDLRFTLDEARTFFAECAGVSLAETAVRRVYSTVEGWAMSMRGVALAVGAGRPVEEVLAGGVLTDDLTEYLLTEVLAVQSGADREFLLRTAPLRSLDPALCTEVTGRADSGRMLARLARRGVFLARDTPAGPYRRHRPRSPTGRRSPTGPRSLTGPHSPTGRHRPWRPARPPGARSPGRPAVAPRRPAAAPRGWGSIPCWSSRRPGHRNRLPPRTGRGRTGRGSGGHCRPPRGRPRPRD